MVVPEPYESPESGREGYCCAYEIYFKGCGLFFPLAELLLTYLNHLGIAFSQMSPNMLRYLMCTFTVAAEVGYSLGLNELLEFFQARESRTSGYYALYPIADRNLIDGLPLKDNAWRKFWFLFRIDSFSVQSSSELLRFRWSSNLGPQIRPVPSVDFLNFYKVVLERPVNWNSFTLERIHGAGHSVRMGLTHPVDPPPAEIDLSSLNARDRRRIREADKKVKDQISQIGKNKKNASSAGDDKIYRKTLLVDEGSLEGSKSMAVTINNAPRSTPAADNMVAATAKEEGLTGDSSFMKKRKAEELELPLQGRIVLKEPLSSGMLPPRRPRGNTSRARSSLSSGLVARASSQSDVSTLALGRNFRPLRAGGLTSRRCISVIHSTPPSIINHYEEELAKVSKNAAVAEGEIEKLQSSSRLVQETAGLDSARREEIERLERSGEETKKNLTETEQKLKNVLADHDFARGEIELLKSELSKISQDARKEVKGAGQKFLLDMQEFISADKARNKLKSERDEMKSNLDLIKEIEEGTVNLAEEKETVGAELAETEAKLATAPQPYLDLQQFASEFADSPPLTEPNTGLSLDEMMLTGSPRAHFNEFRTNIDRISSGRTQGFPGQDLAISSIMGDDFESRSEPPQGTRSLNPEVVLTTQDANVGGAPGSSQITERYVFLCSERQRLGRKRRVLEDRIARTERKIRRLESDVHNWERKGFDSIARIPGCLRKHIRFLKKHWDIYQRSLEPDERENENPSDSFRTISDDLSGAPDIEFIKTGGTGEPEESQILRRGTSIQVPIVLIERLSAQDRVKAEEFINKLIARHDELEDEKKEIRKMRRELEKRRLDIARELHRLEAHPSDWIEIGLQEYGNMPGCIMSVVDLAGQGAELFRNSRPF
ncbi:hypothetical protein ISN45_Aa06g029320 [Arabidopsis thaliana x Arabidopsis arenosa]|uniref:Uncharacterized protein n=1 Tax=Arabidopsis thaliana x Arabidopsis arenosa TaxID=1240361 RepID=A0A8T1Z0I0_9BRAS|nr:hypothetical protein ISN45_Aa06g029320 [Arabidopsis thaliana x Arabidopsis arenosa]